MHSSLFFTDKGLNQRANAYLSELLLFCKREFGEKLISMILFGSHARKTATEVSDVDVIIILDDSIPKRDIKRIRGKIEWLETKHEYFIKSKGITRFFRALERTTGMFVSHFICHESDILEGRFTKIFGVNHFLGKLIAPSDCVLFSIQKHAITLWGKDLLPKMRKPKITTGQLMKSLAMNILQSTGTLVLAPLTKESTRRTLEALKWSIHTGIAWRYQSSYPLSKSIKKLNPNKGFLNDNLSILMSLRKKYRPYPKLILLGPLLVFLIHRKALSNTN